MPRPVKQPDLIPQAIALRATGATFREIGKQLGIPHSTARRYCDLEGTREGTRKREGSESVRVAWDPEDRSWRIRVGGFRILWLRFASPEAAEQHLALRGCP